MWRRRLFTLCSALSLLLCAAVCMLWARSYWVADVLLLDRSDVNNPDDGLWVVSDRGTVQVRRDQFSWPPNTRPLNPVPKTPRGVQYFAVRGQQVAEPFWPAQSYAGFAYANSPYQAGMRGMFGERTVLCVPLYTLALICLLPVVPRLWICLRAWRRQTIGHCPSCGYDLRASPDRCPECGTAKRIPEPASMGER